MEIVDPRVDPALVPEGSRAQVINGPRGDEYRDLPAIRTPDGHVITRWTLSQEERAAVVRGEDIYVTLLSAGAINPFFVTVGPVNWAERTQVESETCKCGHAERDHRHARSMRDRICLKSQCPCRMFVADDPA